MNTVEVTRQHLGVFKGEQSATDLRVSASSLTAEMEAVTRALRRICVCVCERERELELENFILQGL